MWAVEHKSRSFLLESTGSGSFLHQDRDSSLLIMSYMDAAGSGGTAAGSRASADLVVACLSCCVFVSLPARLQFL